MTNRVDLLYAQNWVEQFREDRRRHHFVPIIDAAYGYTARDTINHFLHLASETYPVYEHRSLALRIGNDMNNYFLVG